MVPIYPIFYPFVFSLPAVLPLRKSFSLPMEYAFLHWLRFQG